MSVLTPSKGRSKGVYVFRDPACISSFFAAVQARAIREFPEQALVSGLIQPSDMSALDPPLGARVTRHVVQEELCIGMLELYLVGFDKLPLTEAAKKLPCVGPAGESGQDAARCESNKMKRLYDIANTLRGAGVLEKEMLNGKVVFRWSYSLSPLEIRSRFEAGDRDSSRQAPVATA